MVTKVSYHNDGYGYDCETHHILLDIKDLQKQKPLYSFYNFEVVLSKEDKQWLKTGRRIVKKYGDQKRYIQDTPYHVILQLWGEINLRPLLVKTPPKTRLIQTAHEAAQERALCAVSEIKKLNSMLEELYKLKKQGEGHDLYKEIRLIHDRLKELNGQAFISKIDAKLALLPEQVMKDVEKAISQAYKDKTSVVSERRRGYEYR